MLKNKLILLGITGGIAAYKSAELARLLIKEGASVQVVMTKSAEAFITPLTMKTITGRPVFSSFFNPDEPGHFSATVHIDLAREPHIAVIAPATANILGKMAAGIADDLLSTVLMAVNTAECPIILAPSMNTSMLHNPAVRNNIAVLRGRGYIVADPQEGFLACGEVGEGRMIEPSGLLEIIKKKIRKAGDFSGLTVLITAGPTREALDPVRFLSNHSSGRMGYALARAAQERGAHVILVSGPTALETPPGVDFYPVVSAQDMYEVVMDKLSAADIVIKSAAVADYRPEKTSAQKIKKGGGEMTLKLVRNPDILKEIGKNKRNIFVVGFAAETENVLDNGKKKIVDKNLDMIVANDLTQEGAGFCAETNIVHLLYRDGREEKVPLMSKYELSHLILDRIREIKHS
ncbi:MAG TPA: bifunctional phosphopantothenoylcysteine decarboxylase/phosphopantothenate--cysteine ligase CoaBC [Firmicutes bacterium]|jgi:phosphopantothenoylcysteine decarboxylase/phosphopantothenate--cysteine ligase|nr:bifunctional phosphopantothenoylcysteine decarboxylase/phosphopantothenate--cysteine ligase CoaBC [Bacillota bacterium]